MIHRDEEKRETEMRDYRTSLGALIDHFKHSFNWDQLSFKLGPDIADGMNGQTQYISSYFYQTGLQRN